MASLPSSKAINPIVLLQNITGSAHKSSYHPDDLAVDVAYNISNGYIKGWEESSTKEKDTVLQLLAAIYEGIEISMARRR